MKGNLLKIMVSMKFSQNHSAEHSELAKKWGHLKDSKKKYDLQRFRKELDFRKSLQTKPKAISAAKERRGVRGSLAGQKGQI